MDEILAAWEDYARRFWLGPLPDSATLRNGAEKMLRALVDDMASSQNGVEQKRKSEGGSDAADSEMIRAALGHAISRVGDGFDIGRMVAEFRALRASVNRIWVESHPLPHREQFDDMGRFNEALDQLVAASVAAFTERVDRSRRLFLGILGHDLRQPLYGMRMLTEILTNPDLQPAEAQRVVGNMARSCDVMSRMLKDLLDFTSSQLGCSMPVFPDASDLGAICKEVMDEVQLSAPTRPFVLDADPEVIGIWDANRLRQMVSNLVGNALHHGENVRPISLTLRGGHDEVALVVHNYGKPIPLHSMGTLFDPMVRLPVEDTTRPHGSIGLGLYICREVVHAHGGRIEVESSDENGTTFTVTLPRRSIGTSDASGDVQSSEGGSG